MAPASPQAGKRRRLAALLLALLPTLAWGLSSDRSQPIHIEADKASLDESEGISTYSGNVLLRQGTLKLEGNRMTVYLKNNQVEKVVLAGQPASYSQRSDGEETDQHAVAGNIEYQAVAQRIILLGKARIWQDEAEEFSSDRIEVNLKNNTLNAGGDGPDGRVRIILQPQKRQPEQQAPAE
jgi:lipopolysaccharide export system protein LptA